MSRYPPTPTPFGWCSHSTPPFLHPSTGSIAACPPPSVRRSAVVEYERGPLVHPVHPADELERELRADRRAPADELDALRLLVVPDSELLPEVLLELHHFQADARAQVRLGELLEAPRLGAGGVGDELHVHLLAGLLVGAAALPRAVLAAAGRGRLVLVRLERDALLPVELLLARGVLVPQVREELVHEALHVAVRHDELAGVVPEVRAAHRPRALLLALVQLQPEAALAERVQALGYGVRVPEVAVAEPAGDVLVDVRHLEAHVLGLEPEALQLLRLLRLREVIRRRRRRRRAALRGGRAQRRHRAPARAGVRRGKAPARVCRRPRRRARVRPRTRVDGRRQRHAVGPRPRHGGC
mmetsp:Transcript_41437/g.129767  ORF Transcript_41437/g.129767 Transcript_41437/m.129767 type:complete len:356 (+) Transcript_41437:878-1945(+)